MTKICPYINAPCIKGECIAWIKHSYQDDEGKPLTERACCMVFRN